MGSRGNYLGVSSSVVPLVPYTAKLSSGKTAVRSSLVPHAILLMSFR